MEDPTVDRQRVVDGDLFPGDLLAGPIHGERRPVVEWIPGLVKGGNEVLVLDEDGLWIVRKASWPALTDRDLERGLVSEARRDDAHPHDDQDQRAMAEQRGQGREPIAVGHQVRHGARSLDSHAIPGPPKHVRERGTVNALERAGSRWHRRAKERPAPLDGRFLDVPGDARQARERVARKARREQPHQDRPPPRREDPVELESLDHRGDGPAVPIGQPLESGSGQHRIRERRCAELLDDRPGTSGDDDRDEEDVCRPNRRERVPGSPGRSSQRAAAAGRRAGQRPVDRYQLVSLPRAIRRTMPRSRRT